MLVIEYQSGWEMHTNSEMFARLCMMVRIFLYNVGAMESIKESYSYLYSTGYSKPPVEYDSDSDY